MDLGKRPIILGSNFEEELVQEPHPKLGVIEEGFGVVFGRSPELVLGKVPGIRGGWGQLPVRQ